MPHAIGGTSKSAMTPEKKAALKAYIAKQRQKKKEEEEQDEALRNERQRLAEKKLRDQNTLEEVNTQIVQLEKKLAEFRQEKHDLFAQLKKVLHQEDEQRKRIQQIQQQHAKDASEILAKVGPAAPPPLPFLGSGSSPADESTVPPIQPSLHHPHPNVQMQQMAQPTATLNSGTSPGAVGSISVMPPAKRQRSSSPSTTTTKEPGAYSAYFSSPKRMNTTYQRSPYQSSTFAQEMHSPPGVSSTTSQRIQPGSLGQVGGVSGSMLGMHYQSYLPHGVSTTASSLGGSTTTSSSIMQHARGGQPFRPPHDIRATQMGNLVSSTGSSSHVSMGSSQRSSTLHVSPGGIPVIPPQQKRMGSITSGYPVQKPSHTSSQSGFQQQPQQQQQQPSQSQSQQQREYSDSAHGNYGRKKNWRPRRQKYRSFCKTCREWRRSKTGWCWKCRETDNKYMNREYSRPEGKKKMKKGYKNSNFTSTGGRTWL